MAEAPESSELTALAVNLAAAIRAVHGPAASPNCLVEANRLYNQARSHPKVDILAFQLTAPTAAPEVQHCGFQLVLDRLRQPSGLGPQARSELKNWLVASLTSRRWSPADTSSSVVPPYVRAKCGEAIAEIARGDWPEYWPELKPALMAAAGASPELAALTLNVWSQICDLLAEEAKDLTLERRRELGTALTTLVEEPENAPELIVFLQESLTRHGGNKQVVWEALRFCETLVFAVPVRLLLQHSLDKILQVGLEIPETRELAVSALASWVDCVCPNKADPSSIPARHDLCRFTAFLTRLARRCQFDGSEQNYAFHRQVTELLTDLCANSAFNMCQVMPHAELRDVWGALLHLLRYPSLSIQCDALVAMIQLVKAQDKTQLGSSAPPWPPMEQLLSTVYVHMFKLELWQAEPDDPIRSGWRLSCLGPASAAKQPQSFRSWHQFLAQTHAFDLREGDANAEERSHLFGSVKGKVNDLVTEVCKVAHSLSAGEGYAAVCQVAAQLALRALAPSSSAPGAGQNPSVAEFDAAAFLVERPGPAMLRLALKEDSKKSLDAIVEPSLAFLKQVTPANLALTTALEHRRLEFISHWAPFYGHFDAEVVAQVLERIVAIIQQHSTDDEGISLQRRALDTLVNLGRSGALRPSQLEALNAECPRLALRLPPQSRGKLIEALAAAVAACGDFTHARRAQLISGMMEQATSSWASLELVQADGRGEKLAEVLVAAALVGKAGERHSDAQLAKLRDIRTLAHIFIGVVNRTGHHSEDAGPGNNGDARMSDAGDVTEASSHHLAAEVVKAWAPGMFSLATSVAALNTRVVAPASCRETSEAQAVLAALLGMPGENEHAGMLGRKPDIGEEAASARSLGSVPFSRARPVRGLLWDLRVASAKGVHACTSCRDFWGFPEAITMLGTLASMLPSQRPHVAELLLREVFMPVFGPRAGSGQVAVLVPAPAQQPLCRAVLPVLVQGISQLLCTSWQGSPSDRGLPVPPEFEGGFASSVLAFSREAAFLLTAMSGSQLPQAVSLVNPERWLWRDQDVGGKETRQLSPQRGRKKKNRNSNRFASLADDDMGTPQAPRGRAAPLTPGTPPPSPGKPADSLPARGMPTTIMTDRALREPVRACMVQMLKLPDVETVQRVIVGLAIWQAQLWNMAATGKLVMTEGGPLPEPGELLHAAVEALRGLPRDVLQPLTELVVRPLVVEVSGHQQERAALDATSGTFTLPCSALAGLVQQSWRAFTAGTRSNGKLQPSNLVLAVTQPIWMTLSVLARLFAMQCRRLQHKPSQEHLYVCPSLIEALEVCKSLPDTTEDDVAKLLNRMLDRLANMDSQRSDIRALLHAASRPFRENHDA